MAKNIKIPLSDFNGLTLDMHKTMLRSLTLKRIWNYFLVAFAFRLSIIFRKSVHFGQPLAISFEPTTSCNLRCPECPSGLRAFTRETGMLNPVLFRRVIDEISDRTFYLTLYFQGEPFLNNDVYEMVRYAKDKNMVVVTSTNGHYLSDTNCHKIIESGLDKLIVSIDGASQETYSKYRIGGNLEKVIEGVKMITSLKKKLNVKHPLISVQTVIFSTNEYELDDLRILAESIGADEIKFKTAQVYEYDNGNDLIPQNEKLSRYKRMPDGSYRLRTTLENKCWKMWSSSVITWDGKVVPCCFDKDATHKMGDLSKSTLASVWKSKEYQRFRNLILKSRSSIDICKNCSEGSEVFVG